MKAPPFRYVRAHTLPEVFDLLAEYGDEAKLLAGGQSLIPALNLRLASPSVLVDINRLPALSGVRVEEGCLRIGALTRHRALERSEDVARHAGLIAQAMPHVAHAAIRNRGTFGGSIAYADPAAELPACSVALDAQFVLASRAGERRVPARKFFRGLYETALRPDEVVIAAEFAVSGSPHTRSVFLELPRRRGDYAIAGIAARARYEHGRYSEVSLVFFGVGATPVVAATAAAVLQGKTPSATLPDEVASAVTADLMPDDDVHTSAATKLHLAKVLAARAVNMLVQTPATGGGSA